MGKMTDSFFVSYSPIWELVPSYMDACKYQMSGQFTGRKEISNRMQRFRYLPGTHVWHGAYPTVKSGKIRLCESLVGHRIEPIVGIVTPKPHLGCNDGHNQALDRIKVQIQPFTVRVRYARRATKIQSLPLNPFMLNSTKRCLVYFERVETFPIVELNDSNQKVTWTGLFVDGRPKENGNEQTVSERLL